MCYADFVLYYTVINSLFISRSGDAYVCQSIMFILVLVIVCDLFGDKSLPETMLINCQLDSLRQTETFDQASMCQQTDISIKIFMRVV